MSLKIRMSRAGAKKRPFYRIIITDTRNPRDGRFIERVGTYDPMLPRDDPERVRLNTERVRHWLSMGAKPSDRVARFLGKAEIIAMPPVRDNPIKSKPKAKTLERLEARQKKAEAVTETAAPSAGEAAPEAAPEAEATPEAEAVPAAAPEAEATPEAAPEAESEPEAPAEAAGDVEPAGAAPAESEEAAADEGAAEEEKPDA